MPLHIGRVETDLDVTPSAGTAVPSAAPDPAADAALRDRLRPLVIEILRDELDRIRRTQG